MQTGLADDGEDTTAPCLAHAMRAACNVIAHFPGRLPPAMPLGGSPLGGGPATAIHSTQRCLVGGAGRTLAQILMRCMSVRGKRWAPYPLWRCVGQAYRSCPALAGGCRQNWLNDSTLRPPVGTVNAYTNDSKLAGGTYCLTGAACGAGVAAQRLRWLAG